jgi:peptidoglycan hydrolase-like protein with peptidoglycan-binding domain
MAKSKKKNRSQDIQVIIKNKKVLIGAGLLIALAVILGYSTFAGATYTKQKGTQDISIGCASTTQTSSSYSGTCTKQIQYSLNYICKNKDLPVDGVFGAKTKYRVAQFQHDAKLVTDGKVGSGTWNNLSHWRYKHKTNSLSCSAIINYP